MERMGRQGLTAAGLAALAITAGVVTVLPAGPAAAQEVVTKEYDDGGIYEGTFKDGKQHGRGTYRLPNGYEYTGDWVEGEILGQGKARYPNGSIYEAPSWTASRRARARSPSPTA